MTELSDKPANFLSGIDSFESMFRQQYPFVCNVINKYVIDRSKVEDIAQELFMELWMKKENILIHTSLPAYLRRMAVSRALNYLRDNRKHNWDDIDDTSQHAPDYVAEAPSALQTMEDKELRELITKAIDDLPEKCRVVFHLSRTDEMSYAEISQELGISVKTVENQIGKALKLIRKALHEYRG